MGTRIPTLPGSQSQWKRGVRALKRTTGEGKGSLWPWRVSSSFPEDKRVGESSERKEQAAGCSPLGEMNWACRAAGSRMRREVGRALHPQPSPHCASEVRLGPGATNPCVDRSWEPLCRGQVQVLNQVVILLSPSLGGHPAGSQGEAWLMGLQGKGLPVRGGLSRRGRGTGTSMKSGGQRSVSSS